MPRYFFHTKDGQEFIDRDGTELPDVRRAQREAVVHAGELMRDNPQAFLDGKDWTMRVTDADGLVLFELLFFVSLAPALSEG